MQKYIDFPGRFWSELLCLMLLMHSVLALLQPSDSSTRYTKSLDGIWKFNLLPNFPEPFGDRLTTIENNESPISMPVPASFNDITSNQTIRDWRGWVMYQTEFYTPMLQKDQQLWVHFGSVHYRCYVLVNGFILGRHVVGHLPFQFRIPEQVYFTNKTNLLVVLVNNELNRETIPQADIQQPQNNSFAVYPVNYTEVKNHFDFFNYAGIHRPVHLCVFPSTYIEDIQWMTMVEGKYEKTLMTKISPKKRSTWEDVAQFTINYDIKVAHATALKNNYTCVLLILDKEGKVYKSYPHCNLKRLQLEARVWQPKIFTKKLPYLYTIKVQLLATEHNNLIDEYSFQTGFRSIKCTEDSLVINGLEVYLTGFGRHEDSAIHGRGFDAALNVKDTNLIEWIGANSYRTSHYPYSDQLMDLADQQGLLIINELPAVALTNFTRQLLELHKQLLKQLWQRDQHRPSTIAWSVANEPLSQLNESGPYWQELIDLAHQLDPSRPVTAALNAPFSVDHCAEYLDFIMLNRYYAWYSDAGQLSLISLQLSTDILSWKAKFRKPLLISEYGADTLAGLHSQMNQVFSEDFQTAYLRKHFKVFDQLRSERKLAGEMIWNFADFNTDSSITRVMGNRKGIFTRDREPKASARLLRCRYLQIQAQQRNHTFEPGSNC